VQWRAAAGLLGCWAAGLLGCWAAGLAARLPPTACPAAPTACLPPTTRAGLNMSVFLLIGKTSALTMNIAGVLKDWLLIIVSVMMYKCAAL
jgi:hypothetical protein